MGNQLAAQTAVPLDVTLHDLDGFAYEATLGRGRFMKTLLCVSVADAAYLANASASHGGHAHGGGVVGGSHYGDEAGGQDSHGGGMMMQGGGGAGGGISSGLNSTMMMVGKGGATGGVLSPGGSRGGKDLVMLNGGDGTGAMDGGGDGSSSMMTSAGMLSSGVGGVGLGGDGDDDQLGGDDDERSSRADNGSSSSMRLRAGTRVVAKVYIRREDDDLELNLTRPHDRSSGRQGNSENVPLPVHLLPGEISESEMLREHADKLEDQRANCELIEAPNVITFQHWVASDVTRAVYVIRPYFKHNLYDRFSTRPFLTPAEKRWIVFQLLTGVSQAHFHGFCHGDIKCENLMCTSWLWVYLVDFAGYKPVYLPTDNSADFSFFFDSAQRRRTCYIAPERFRDSQVNKADQAGGTALTREMDMFSVGCVIAEIFLDGAALFDFGELLAYKRGEFDPSSRVNRIGDPFVQELVKRCISLDTALRPSAADALEEFSRDESSIFPAYFPFLHRYIDTLVRVCDADEKVHAIHDNFRQLLRILTGKSRAPTTGTFHQRPTPFPIGNFGATSQPVQPSASRPETIDVEDENADFSLLVRIEKFVHSVEASLKHHAAEDTSADEVEILRDATPISLLDRSKTTTKDATLSPATFADLTNVPFFSPEECEGLVILLNVLCSFINVIPQVSTKLQAVELFSLFGSHVDDDLCLQRVVPYLMSLMQEPRGGSVRAAALRTLAALLSRVREFPPSDSQLFPSYVVPVLATMSSASFELDEVVREALADTLGLFAQTAKRFLETVHMNRHHHENKEGGNRRGRPGPVVREDELEVTGAESTQAEDLLALQNAFHEIVVDMLTKEKSTAVRRTLLTHMYDICDFLGRQKTNDFVLPLIITFLNDRHNWQLRRAFFHDIWRVSWIVGVESTQSFILPCVLQALSDESESVVFCAVDVLGKLAQHSMLRRNVAFDIVGRISCLLIHPSIWIRTAATRALCLLSRKLSEADVLAFVIPEVVKYVHKIPVLTAEVPKFVHTFLFVRHLRDEKLLSPLLQTPLSRRVYDQAVQIAREVLSLPYSQRIPGEDPFDAEFERRIIQMWMNGQFSLSKFELRKSLSSRSSSAGQDANEIDSPLFERILSLKHFVQARARQAMLEHDNSSDYRAGSSFSQRFVPPLQPTSLKLTSRRAFEVVAPRPARRKAGPVKLSQDSMLLHRAQVSMPSVYATTREEAITSPDRAFFYPFGVHEKQISMSAALGQIPKQPTKVVEADARVEPAEVVSTTDLFSVRQARRPDAAAVSSPRPAAARPAPVRSALKPNHLVPSNVFPRQSPPLGKLNLAFIAEHSADVFAVSKWPELLDSEGLAGSAFPREPIPPSSLGCTGQSLRTWKPEGLLIAHLQEHTGPVNRLCVSGDNMFFASASDDGTVRVWDTVRLVNHVTNHSRVCYRGQNGMIKDLVMCEGSHSIASASSTGSVHVFRIDLVTSSRRDGDADEEAGGASKSSVTRFKTPPATVRTITLPPEDGPVVALQQFSTPGWGMSAQSHPQSLVLAASGGSARVHAFDLRAKRPAFVLLNPPHYGSLSTFCCGSSYADPWIVTGTTTGCYTLWDARFAIPVNSWREPVSSTSPYDSLAIHRLTPYTGKFSGQPFGLPLDGMLRGPFVLSCAGQRTSLWDIRTGECAAVLRVADRPAQDEESKARLELPLYSRTAPLWGVPNPLKYGGDVIARFGSKSRSSLGVSCARAILNNPGSDVIFSAGDDLAIRSWQLNDPEASACIAAPESCTSGENYRTVPWSFGKFSRFNHDGVAYIEHCLTASARRDAQNGVTSSLPLSLSARASAGASEIPAPALGTEIHSGADDHMSSLISTQALVHRETVTDLASLEIPHPLLLSCGRDGVVKAWT